MPGRRAKRIRAATKVPVAFIGAGARFSGELVDASTTGMLVRCPENIEIGTPGRIGIQVGWETLRCAVVVRRHIQGVGVGFEITHMNPHDRELLRRLLMWLARPSAGTG